MIYIIDDKKSRQKDFGWSRERFETYSADITPIWSIEELNEKKEAILQDGNIILFHESFFSSESADRTAIIESFRKELTENANNLHITYFSGSKSGRKVEDRVCMLPPDVLYSNLEAFIDKLRAGDLSFRYLAFGENSSVEASLLERLDQINDENAGGDKVSVPGNVFFAATYGDSEVEPPFDNVEIKSDWDLDLLDKAITDQDLDGLVNNWFNETKFDVIYIPLCFGDTLSDFMGLRLAMHIRLTPTRNQTTPVFIYGVATYEEMKQNYCFDILKTSTVRLIGCDNDSFIASVKSEMSICYLPKEIKLIHLDLPSNIGSHSLANQWGVDVLNRATINQDLQIQELEESKKLLYFKYISTKTLCKQNTNEDDEIEESQIEKLPIKAIGKRILLIDDEADKWYPVLEKMFYGAKINTIQERVSDYVYLSESAREEIELGDYDLFFLDLRMGGVEEEDKLKPNDFSGMKILEAIKHNNKGSQVIILTASNKAWNMKALLEAGANGYYIKESPEYAFSPIHSQENANVLIREIKNCLNRGYLRQIYKKIKNIEARSTETYEPSSLERILKQLYASYFLIDKAKTKDEFALAYISLENVFEILSDELLEPISKLDYEIILTGELCKHWIIDDEWCNETNEKPHNKYPIWQQIASIYYQLVEGNNLRFGTKIYHLVETRNAYIHNDKKKQKKKIQIGEEWISYANIFNKNGFITLFDTIYDLITQLLNKSIF